MDIVAKKIGSDIAKYMVADYLMISLTDVRKNFAKVIKQLDKIKQNYTECILEDDTRPKVQFFNFAISYNSRKKTVTQRGKHKYISYTYRKIKPNDTMFNIYFSWITKEDLEKRRMKVYANLETIIEEEVVSESDNEEDKTNDSSDSYDYGRSYGNGLLTGLFNKSYKGVPFTVKPRKRRHYGRRRI
jgi:hypothetical protein